MQTRPFCNLKHKPREYNHRLYIIYGITTPFSVQLLALIYQCMVVTTTDQI